MSGLLPRLWVGRVIVGACLAGTMVAPGGASNAAQPITFDYGVACGEMSSTDAVLWTRTSDAATLTPELVDGAGVAIRSLPSVTTTADADFTVKTVVDDLTPGLADPLSVPRPGRAS